MFYKLITRSCPGMNSYDVVASPFGRRQLQVFQNSNAAPQVTSFSSLFKTLSFSNYYHFYFFIMCNFPDFSSVLRIFLMGQLLPSSKSYFRTTKMSDISTHEHPDPKMICRPSTHGHDLSGLFLIFSNRTFRLDANFIEASKSLVFYVYRDRTSLHA